MLGRGYGINVYPHPGVVANGYGSKERGADMTLPDRFEQVGIIVGSVLIVALPASSLGTALFGFTPSPWVAIGLWLLPGLIVGLLLAAGYLPVTYHQVWTFSMSSWLLAFAGWAVLGLSVPSANRPLALLVWTGAIGVGALVAWIRPIARLRCGSQLI